MLINVDQIFCHMASWLNFASDNLCYKMYFDGTSNFTSKVIQVKIEKEKDSFGFTLRDGTYNDRLKCRSLIITHIRFGGPADRTGILKTGDRLLGVDGVNLSTASLNEALQFLKQIKQFAIITVEYDVSCIDAVKNATGPLLVEIDRTPGSLLGINLSCLSVPEHAIVIESIRQASIAERCGALHVGDHVLAIEGIKVDLMTSAEAMQLLRLSIGETVKLEILPVSQIAMRSSVDSYMKRGGKNILHVSTLHSKPTKCEVDVLDQLARKILTQVSPYLDSGQLKQISNILDLAAINTLMDKKN
ncbi:glutamate receptor-interacting protein 2 [Trichonephila clavipes]|nr:glutamate receptor-interacting protein 2 [Trichonephila clavipes]